MRVLVTGGAGFIGTHTARELLASGHEVLLYDDLSSGRRENVPEGAELIVGDVRAPSLRELMAARRVEAVVHLAAQMDVRRSVAEPLFDAELNVLGTVNVLEGARAAGTQRVVFASSGGAIYGEQDAFPATEEHPRRPSSPYGVSKLCGEEYLELYRRTYGLSTLALRYANVYGPVQSPHGEAGVVAIFLDRMLRGVAPVVNGDGEQTRDYVYGPDVARANRLAVESEVTGALNIGTGVETSVNALAAQLARAARWKQPLAHGPAKAGEQRRSVVDAGAAKAALGWAPSVALADGLAHTAAWFRERAGRG